jgi:hypothetical protein
MPLLAKTKYVQIIFASVIAGSQIDYPVTPQNCPSDGLMRSPGNSGSGQLAEIRTGSDLI